MLRCRATTAISALSALIAIGASAQGLRERSAALAPRETAPPRASDAAPPPVWEPPPAPPPPVRRPPPAPPPPVILPTIHIESEEIKMENESENSNETQYESEKNEIEIKSEEETIVVGCVGSQPDPPDDEPPLDDE
jgi:hypothetical protein